MKLMSLDKQVRVLATKWYVNEYFYEELKYADKEERKEIIRSVRDNVDKQHLINKYFETHPKVKEQYEAKKQTIRRIKTMIGLGTLTVALGVGTAYRTNHKIVDTPTAIETENKDYDQQQDIQEEQEMKIESKQDIDQESLIADEVDYSQFFDEISGMKNTENRDKAIVEFTKERIVDAYNMQHEDKITSDRLQYLHLNEYVVAHKDKFGNDVSYERVDVRERDDVKQDETQELKQIGGGFYEFKIDGKVVAVYDGSGQEVVDKNIEEKQEFFKDSLDLIKEATNLQDIYKYMSNDNEKKMAQNEYKETSNQLLQDNKMIQANKQLDR